MERMVMPSFVCYRPVAGSFHRASGGPPYGTKATMEVQLILKEPSARAA